MEFRRLGASGLKVPVLGFGSATFGGIDYFKSIGEVDVTQARRMVDICLDAGVCLFDTADAYSFGLAEEILGEALAGRRDRVLLSTKGTFPMGDGPNEFGSSRYHLMRTIEGSLRRLGTDHIDIYHMHGFDAGTPVEETLRTLDDLVSAGKVRYVACSNFSGWHLMKSLAVADRHGLSRYVAHQVNYSLLDREFEWELMPLAVDQGVGTLVWSPLSNGRLSGKFRRGQPLPEVTRLASQAEEVIDARVYDVVDELAAIAEETGRTIPQVAINWLLQRPTVSSVILGARTEAQLLDNLGALGWNLDADQVARLDRVSHRSRIYPYSHQRFFPQLSDAVVL